MQMSNILWCSVEDENAQVTPDSDAAENRFVNNSSIPTLESLFIAQSVDEDNNQQLGAMENSADKNDSETSSSEDHNGIPTERSLILDKEHGFWDYIYILFIWYNIIYTYMYNIYIYLYVIYMYIRVVFNFWKVKYF